MQAEGEVLSETDSFRYQQLLGELSDKIILLSSVAKHNSKIQENPSGTRVEYLLSEQKELLQTTQKDVTDKYKQLKSVAEALDVALQESADGVAKTLQTISKVRDGTLSLISECQMELQKSNSFHAFAETITAHNEMQHRLLEAQKGAQIAEQTRKSLEKELEFQKQRRETDIGACRKLISTLSSTLRSVQEECGTEVYLYGADSNSQIESKTRCLDSIKKNLENDLKATNSKNILEEKVHSQISKYLQRESESDAIKHSSWKLEADEKLSTINREYKLLEQERHTNLKVLEMLRDRKNQYTASAEKDSLERRIRLTAIEESDKAGANRMIKCVIKIQRWWRKVFQSKKPDKLNKKSSALSETGGLKQKDAKKRPKTAKK